MKYLDDEIIAKLPQVTALILQLGQSGSMFEKHVATIAKVLEQAAGQLNEAKEKKDHLSLYLDVLQSDFKQILEALGKNINANEILKHDIDSSINRIKHLEGIDVEFVKSAMEVAAEDMRKSVIRSVNKTVSEAKMRTTFFIGTLCGVMLIRFAN